MDGLVDTTIARARWSEARHHSEPTAPLEHPEELQQGESPGEDMLIEWMESLSVKNMEHTHRSGAR
jgi:hypothetical protein